MRAIAVAAVVFAASGCGEADKAALPESAVPLADAPVRELRFDESLRFTPPRRGFVLVGDFDSPDGPPPRVSNQLLAKAFRLWPVHNNAPVVD